MSFSVTDRQVQDSFGESHDFIRRILSVGGQQVFCYMIDGLVSGNAASEYVLEPLSRMTPESAETLYRHALEGRVYNSVAEACNTLNAILCKLVNGFCVVLFPEVGAVAYEVKTSDTRSISAPDVENTIKCPKDAFTEIIRTNTGILRRHLRTPDLRIRGIEVGQYSKTCVSVIWIQGLTDECLVKRTSKRLEEMKTCGLLSPAAVEEMVTGSRKTPFPLIQYTQRSDKFAQGLLSGRVGILVDGLPLGYLLPVDLQYLMTSPEDLGVDYITASFVRILRYGALLISLLLPAVYIALTEFHQQMIPLPLLRAMIESKQSVPFSSTGEILGLMLAFELLQQAGIHLPKSVGQSVSIIGGIVVGTAAVEASLVSPSALIVVSLGGVCGFALPNQDLTDALRLCSFGLTVIAAGAGLFGVVVGWIVLVYHLAGLKSLGVSYLVPFSELETQKVLRERFQSEGPE